MQYQEECDAVFVEDGVSALQKNRPIYRQLLETLKEGDVLTVIFGGSSLSIRHRRALRA